MRETRNPVDKFIGQQVSAAMKARSLAAEDLAIELGVSRDTVEAFCSGRQRLKASQLFALSQILGCSVSYFFLPDGEISDHSASNSNRKLQ